MVNTEFHFESQLIEHRTNIFHVFHFFSADAQKCELICQSEETGDVVFMNQVVHDGTRCTYRDPYSVCVRGECVVCNLQVHSSFRNFSEGLIIDI